MNAHDREIDPVLSQPGSGVSRYAQLATLFRRHIAMGRWKIGDQIPTIDELAESHGVARATVRQALDILANEKLIERFRAKGTFVTHHPQENLWCEVFTDLPAMQRARADATIETLSEELGVQPLLPPDLEEHRAKSYRRFRRRHWRIGEAFLLADVYLDEAICKKVTRQQIASRTGMQLLKEVPGLEIANARQILTIGGADMVVAAHLGLELNAPIAFMRRFAQDKDDKVVLAAQSIYRGDAVWISMKLK